MARPSPITHTLTVDPTVELQQLLASYERHLMASRKRPQTTELYLKTPRRFHEYGIARGFPLIVNIRREHIETWLASINEAGRSSYTQRAYFVVLRQWFRWLTDEGEIPKNPMDRMKAPALDEVQKDVVTEEEMAAALASLQKAKNWRDLAIVALLYDTGMRSTETCTLLISDLDFAASVIHLRGTETKGRVGRVVPISATAAAHIDRYLRKRRDTLPWLFVGQQGQLGRAGMYVIIRRAFAFTGRTIGPHDLRHTSATHTAGTISDTDRMLIYGWKDAGMARHYSRQAEQANAITAFRKASPLENLQK